MVFFIIKKPFDHQGNQRVCYLKLAGGGGRIRTYEAFATDLQSAPVGHFGTPPDTVPYYNHHSLK